MTAQEATVSVHVRNFPADVWKQARDAAALREESVRDLLALALREFLERRAPKERNGTWHFRIPNSTGDQLQSVNVKLRHHQARSRGEDGRIPRRHRAADRIAARPQAHDAADRGRAHRGGLRHRQGAAMAEPSLKRQPACACETYADLEGAFLGPAGWATPGPGVRPSGAHRQVWAP